MSIQGIVLVGRPGAGKSSIGRTMAEVDDDFVFIPCGDIVRKLAETDDDVRRTLSNGQPAPEDKVRTAIQDRLLNVPDGSIFILDGFPRFPDQLKWLCDRFPKIIVYEVRVPEYKCIERMMERKREFEDINNIMRRLSWYDANTEPMIRLLGDAVIVIDNGADLGWQNAVTKISEDLYRRLYADCTQNSWNGYVE